MRILFTGGGTLGHIMPQIAVMRELKRLYPKADLFLHYIGPFDPLSLLLFKQENVKTHAIVSGKIRRYFSLKNVIDIVFNLPFGFLQSFFLLLFIRPKLVFSKGGSGSLPVTFCARLLFIPVFLHESDIVPGMSNQTTSKWAKKVFISFPKTEYFDLSKAILTGNPVRKELLEGSHERAKEIFNLFLEKPVLFFWGGSQGSEAINDFLLLALNDILKNYEVIHVCGEKNYKKMKLEGEMVLPDELEKNYHLRGAVGEQELKHILAVADLIISRAGSGSVFEIAAAGKPSILVPLPASAGNHQSKNAYEYAKTGAAVILEQENLTLNFFAGKIGYLFASPDAMETMRQAALEFAKPLAAKAIAREILEYLHAN